MAVTPGLYFLTTVLLPVLFGPPLVIHAILILLSQRWPVFSVTRGLLLCVYVFSDPVFYHISSRVRRLKVSLSAQRLGVRVAPRAEGLLPWNFDILVKVLTVNKTSYIADPVLDAFNLVPGGTNTCTLEILGDERFLTMHPENIKKVLSTDFDNYCKGSMFNGIMTALLGVGVFNSDGEMWQFHRKSWWSIVCMPRCE